MILAIMSVTDKWTADKASLLDMERCRRTRRFTPENST